MAKIIANVDYVDNGDVKQTGKYLFVAEEGAAPVDLVVWLEKSKANDKHPDGKPWIKLPNGNITNRAYFSEDLFLETAVDGEVTVEIKTTAPRVLGATGVKQDILRYLDEAVAAEYTELVEGAVAKYKDAKAGNKRLKPEEMNKEQLEAYIEALRNGTKLTVATGPKSFLDVFNDDEYARYNEILALAQENKANAPKAVRKPLTDEEKVARAKKRQATEINKAQALLAQLMGGTVHVADEVEEDFDDEE